MTINNKLKETWKKVFMPQFVTMFHYQLARKITKRKRTPHVRIAVYG
jgi:hypothetical protein